MTGYITEPARAGSRPGLAAQAAAESCRLEPTVTAFGPGRDYSSGPVQLELGSERFKLPTVTQLDHRDTSGHTVAKSSSDSESEPGLLLAVGHV